MLAAVLVCTVTAGGIFYYVRKAQIRNQYAGWRSEGLAAASKNDYAQAIDYLGRYIRRYPDDDEILIEYVRVRTESTPLGNRSTLRDVTTVLKHLLQLRPDLQPQRRQLLQIYSDYGYTTETLELADNVLKSAPDDAAIHGMRCKALARLNRHADALESARTWARLAPEDPASHIAILELMKVLQSGDEELLGYAQKNLDEHPADARSELVKGKALILAGRIEEASGVLKSAASRADSTVETSRLLCDELNSLGLYAESLTVLEGLVAARKDLADRNQLIHRFWEAGRANDVLAQIASLPAVELERDPGLVGMQATSLWQLGRKEESNALQARLVEIAGTNSKAAEKGSSGSAIAGAWVEILNLIHSLETCDGKALLQACQLALQEQPRDSYVRFFLAEAYARFGETEIAIRTWKEVSEANPTWPLPLLRMSNLLLQRGQYDPALAAAHAAYQRSPNQGVLNLITVWTASIEADQRADTTALLAAVVEFRTQVPAEENVLLSHISILAKLGRSAEATALAKPILDGATPVSESAYIRLAAIARVYKFEFEEQSFSASERVHGTTPTLAMARAIGCLADRREEAWPVFAKARARAAGPADSLEWDLAAARVAELSGADTAKSLWMQLGEKYPENLVVQQSCCSMRSVQGELAFLEQSIKRLRALTGEQGLLWRLHEARRLLTWEVPDAEVSANAEKAMLLIAEIVRRAPDMAEARFLQARSLELLKRSAEAIEQMQAAYRLNPRNAFVSLYLAQLLQNRGDFIQAREHLEKIAGSDEIKNSTQLQWAARLLAKQGDPKAAIDLLADVRLAAGDRQEQQLLAMLYRQQNDLAASEKICSLLIEQGDRDLTVLRMAAEVYEAMNRPEDAARVLALLDEAKLVEPGIKSLALAEHAMKFGRLDQSIQFAERATREAPQNDATWNALILGHVGKGKLDEASRALEKGEAALPKSARLAKLKVLLRDPSVVSAVSADPVLRGLAIELVGAPEHNEYLEAIRVPADARAQVAEPAQALLRLRQIADRNPRSFPVQMLVIQRYLGARQFRDALNLASSVTQAFPTAPQPPRLAAMAAALLGQFDVAVEFAKVWRARQNGDATAADLFAASALARLGKFDDAAKQLAGYFPVALSKPEGNAELIVVYAATLMGAGRANEARDLVMGVIPVSLGVRHRWLSHVAASASPADASAWLVRAGEPFAMTPLERALLATLWGEVAIRTQDPGAVVKCDALVISVMNDPTAPPESLGLLANLAERRQDIKLAEQLYQKTVTANPSDAVALNNLALIRSKNAGTVKESVTMAQRATALKSDVPDFWDTLATAQIASGDLKGAAASLQKAVNLDPFSIPWRIALAEVVASTGPAGDIEKMVKQIDGMQEAASLSEELKERLDKLRALTRQRSPVADAMPRDASSSNSRLNPAPTRESLAPAQ